MKHVFSLIFIIAQCSFLLAQENNPKTKDECHVKNLTLRSVDSSHFLYDLILFDSIFESVSVHPFLIQELGGWNNFVNGIKSDTSVTFMYEGSYKSRLFEGTFHRYQQYYNGIKVNDGGFTILSDNPDVNARPDPSCPTCPEPDPCNEMIFLKPFINENININVVPSITNTQLTSILDITSDDILDQELQIVNNMAGECEYRLVYRLTFIEDDEDESIAWIDAQTGDILHITSNYAFKNGPTADHGIQFMRDSDDGDNTFFEK